MLKEKDGGGPMKIRFEVGGGLHASHENRRLEVVRTMCHAIVAA
jgi:hypothetical protein